MLKNIDWNLLKHQKMSLCEVMACIEKGEKIDKIHLTDLDGILHLLDSIQDEAVREDPSLEDIVF
jgi:hypothetical protein